MHDRLKQRFQQLSKTAYGHSPVLALALVSSVLAGLAGGFIHGLVARVPYATAWSIACAFAGLCALAAVALGLAEWLLATIAGALFRKRRFVRRTRAWLRLVSSRTLTSGRPLIVRVHALAVAWLVALGVVCAAAVPVGARLLKLQVHSVALTGLVVLLSLACLLASLLAWLLVKALEPLVAMVDRRVRLPLPPWRGSRLLLFVYAPLLALLGLGLVRYGTSLGKLIWFPLLAVFFVTQLALLAPGRALRKWAGKRGAVLGVFALSVAVSTLVVWTSRRLEPGSHLQSVVSNTAGIGRILSVVRFASDFDRDGASAWFGGTDCAGFDKTRGPGARDIPDNHIDEDCDGLDARGGDRIPNAPTLATYSERLPSVHLKKYNIVWVIVDALRVDHTSAFGYKRRTTPYLELIAKDSVAFSEVLAQSSATLFSLPSQFSGRNPISVQWFRATDPKLPSWHEQGLQQLADEHELAAEVFRAAGYRTGITLTTHLINSYKSIQRGYERVTDLWATEHHMVTSPVATTQAITLIEEFRHDPTQPDKPFFLTVYYEDPHGPYSRHDEGYPEFGNAPMDVYDQEIAYADRHIGFLYEFLRNRPEIWKDTIFIVTSDHGEEFFEHGWDWHSHSCYAESLRVPLLLRIPDFAPRRIDTPVALVDILPTLYELTGVRPKGKLDGQSLLVPILAGDRLQANRPFYCAISNRNLVQEPFFISSVRVNKRTLTYSLPEDRYRFFETDRDPGELKDVFASRDSTPEVRMLRAWLAAESTGNMRDIAGFPLQVTGQR